MEETYVLAWTHCAEEPEEGAGTFGEFKHVETFVGDRGAAAGDVADVGLCEFVVGDVFGRHAGFFEAGEEGGEFGWAGGGVGDSDTDKDVGFEWVGGVVKIEKLSNVGVTSGVNKY